MDYDNALDYLYSIQGFGKKPGLYGIKKLMSLLGNPQNELNFIHIAGTNGKGSATAMTSNILKYAGYKTGMFISPYIVDFRERIQINGEMISKQNFVNVVEKVKTQIETMEQQGEHLGFFEVVAAIAFCYFAMEKCDIVCLEVGLGGRFDATNIIQSSLASVIMSISLDHTELLGNTVEKIAFEKCGILKDGGACICYPLQDKAALNEIKKQAEIKQNKFVLADIERLESVNHGYYSTIKYNGNEINLPLPGRHQIANAATVLSVIDCIKEKGINVSDKAVIDGIESVKFPARLELVSKNPDILIDGAHNIAGAQSLGAFIQSHPDVPKVLVFGILKDKDYKKIIEEVFPKVDFVIATTPKIPRAMSGKEISIIGKDYCSNIFHEDDYSAVIQKAKELAGESGVIFISGSLYLASDMRRFFIG